MDTVGKRLRAAREAQGYTIQRLHELSMVPEDHILEFEADRHFPNFSALAALREPLKCSVEWLLTGKVPPINPLYSSAACDGVPLSSLETDLVGMFRLLNEHDRKCAFDFVAMLYGQTAENHPSAYSSYASDPGMEADR